MITLNALFRIKRSATKGPIGIYKQVKLQSFDINRGVVRRFLKIGYPSTSESKSEVGQEHQ